MKQNNSLKIKLSLKVHSNYGRYSSCLVGTASSSKWLFQICFFFSC